MFGRTVTVIAVVLSNTLLAAEVSAQTTLNRAVVQTVRNSVQVLRQNQAPRAARVSDVLTPGNGVSTARSSFAELRFNDGSLGRLGEQVVFWFSAGTRNFRLSNGTVLLLIPPGQGSTQIRTPNAAAGIQGSALFVRYILETDTTIVGALTDSNIQVSNRDGTQQQTLRGGQMVVAIGDRLDRIYDFDLNAFYETSELVRGLAPGEEANSGESADPAIAQVQAEMQTAIEQQLPLPTDEILETPGFMRRSEGSPDPVPAELTPDTNFNNAAPNGFSEGQSDAVLEDRLDRVITDPRVDEQRREPESEPEPEPPSDRPPSADPHNNGGGEYPGMGGGDSPSNGSGNGGSDRPTDPAIDRPTDRPTDPPGNSDGTPGGGNDNNPGNSGNGSTDGPGNSDGIPGGGNQNNPGNSGNRPNAAGAIPDRGNIRSQ